MNLYKTSLNNKKWRDKSDPPFRRYCSFWLTNKFSEQRSQTTNSLTGSNGMEKSNQEQSEPVVVIVEWVLVGMLHVVVLLVVHAGRHGLKDVGRAVGRVGGGALRGGRRRRRHVYFGDRHVVSRQWHLVHSVQRQSVVLAGVVRVQTGDLPWISHKIRRVLKLAIDPSHCNEWLMDQSWKRSDSWLGTGFPCPIQRRSLFCLETGFLEVRFKMRPPVLRPTGCFFCSFSSLLVFVSRLVASPRRSTQMIESRQWAVAISLFSAQYVLLLLLFLHCYPVKEMIWSIPIRVPSASVPCWGTGPRTRSRRPWRAVRWCRRWAAAATPSPVSTSGGRATVPARPTRRAASTWSPSRACEAAADAAASRSRAAARRQSRPARAARRRRWTAPAAGWPPAAPPDTLPAPPAPAVVPSPECRNRETSLISRRAHARLHWATLDDTLRHIMPDSARFGRHQHFHWAHFSTWSNPT